MKRQTVTRLLAVTLSASLLLPYTAQAAVDDQTAAEQAILEQEESEQEAGQETAADTPKIPEGDENIQAEDPALSDGTDAQEAGNSGEEQQNIRDDQEQPDGTSGKEAAGDQPKEALGSQETENRQDARSQADLETPSQPAQVTPKAQEGETDTGVSETAKDAGEDETQEDTETPEAEEEADTLGNWVRSGSRWWYQYRDGSYPRSQWEDIDGSRYYFDAAGWMVTGWQQIGGVWYYMSAGGQMQTGWQRIGGSWYYLTGSGAMATGWLQLGDDWYYLGSDGAMYANRWYGNYYLTADGTWDPDREGDQLDTLLQQVIDQVTTQAMSQEGKLRACYDYVVNTFSYERKYNFSNAAGWQRQYALEMLTKGRGNCYNFAATFGCLAEKLGYSNVRTIAGMTGKAGGGWTPHSWVEIDMNGTTYIFDPEMEHANGYDLWKKTYATSPLRYQKF